MLVRAGVMALCAASSACYFYFPDNVKVATAPAIAPGEEVKLEGGVLTGDVKCTDNLEGCTIKDGDAKREYSYATMRGSYAGEVLTNGELRALVDPEKHKQLYRKLAEYKSTCNLSLVPSGIFAAGALVETVGFAAQDKIPHFEYVIIGGAIAMLAGAALSYPLGGYACMRGRDFYSANFLSRDAKKHFDVVEGSNAAAQTALEIAAAVDKFNERARASAPPASTNAGGDAAPPAE